MKKRYLVVFFLFFSFQIFSSQNISSILEVCSCKERESLSYLFKRLLLQEDFAYCLFGTKAVAIDDGVYPNSDWEPFPTISEKKGEKVLYEQGVRTWQKYKHLFDLKKFVFLDEEEDLFPKSIGIALINKEEFKKTVDSHLSLFRSILGTEVTGDLLLEKIECGKVSLKKAIAHHEGLLGILLGYGEVNGMLFHEKITLFRTLERPTLLHFISDHSQLRPNYEKVCEKLKCFSSFDETPSLLNPLYFGADITHPETIALQKKYQLERESITQILSREDFLEITLSRLTCD